MSDPHAGSVPVPGGVSLRPSRLRPMLAIVTLCVLSAVWITLAMTVLFVGPAEWDDVKYCDIAALPRADTFVPNRYVHIWTLRLFYLLVGSMRPAAGLYSALTVVGMMWVGYFVGRRMSGPGCGLIAAVLMPFYPVLLRYLTVPYSDEPMALWSGAALLCALLAGEEAPARRRWAAVVASGLFCLMAVKCKETGLAVLPAVLWLVCVRRHTGRSLAQWVGGVLLGWVGLIALDGIFMQDAWFSCRLSSYLPDRTPSPTDAKAVISAGVEYVELLTTRSFLAFTLLGVGGALVSFRDNRVVRAVAIWLFGVIAFQSLIACRYKGIEALDRYCVGIGVPLVMLGAHWIVTLWRRPHGVESGRPIALTLVLAGLVGLTGYGLWTQITGGPEPTRVAWRLYFFLLPLALITLFVAGWLSASRWLARISVVVLVALAFVVSVSDAVRWMRRSEGRLSDWVELVGELERSGARLAVWDLPARPFSPYRIAWRCRALSTGRPERIAVRRVSTLDEIRQDEWLVTDAKWWQERGEQRRQLLSRGWRPVMSVFERKSGFVVWRPAEGPQRTPR